VNGLRQNPISNSARGSDEKFANAEMQLLDQGGGDDLGIRKETGCLFEGKKKWASRVSLIVPSLFFRRDQSSWNHKEEQTKQGR
jgi:hypothetical protein